MANRACAEFKLQAQRDGWCWRPSRSHGKAYPYLPLIELLNTYSSSPQDDDRRRREQVTGKVLTWIAIWRTRWATSALVGVEEAAASLAHLEPQLRRRQTFEASRGCCSLKA